MCPGLGIVLRTRRFWMLYSDSSNSVWVVLSDVRYRGSVTDFTTVEHIASSTHYWNIDFWRTEAELTGDMSGSLPPSPEHSVKLSQF